MLITNELLTIKIDIIIRAMSRKKVMNTHGNNQIIKNPNKINLKI